MSFDFGIGDFLAIIKLANDIRRDFADAPEQFQQINAEIRNLVIVLGDVDVSLATHDVSSDQNNNLDEIRRSCRSVLENSRKELRKYYSLESKGGSLHKRTERVWKRIKWEPDGVRDLRDQITANIVALNSFTGANIRDTVFKLEERQIRQELLETLEWLTPFDPTAQQADFIRRRQPGTGQWLLNSPKYTEWKATKGGILFCHGIPGAGKTVLSSIVVENLQDEFCIDADIAVCYWYFNFKSQDEQSLENVLLSLLKQISYASTTVPKKVQALFNQCMSKRRRPSVEEIMKTLCSTAGLFSRVLIVVDALDECQTFNGYQSQLISHLIELQRTTGANILATSRPVPHIVQRFNAFASLEVLASTDDINSYVERNIEHLPRFVSKDKTLQDEIKGEISKAVDGMFLLAKLHLDSLKGKRSPKALRQTLNALATGNDAYDEAYQNTMLRIKGQLSDQQELAISTLMWIVHAKRPLTTLELQHALGVEIGEPVFFEDSLPDLDDLVSACCGLVTIDEESQIIRLIHYTAQEFFDRHGVLYFPGAEAQVTDICATYLAFDVFDSGPCQTDGDFQLRLTEFPFYSYSSQHWGQHADSQENSETVHRFLNLSSHIEACGHSLTIMESWYGKRGDFRVDEGTHNMTGLHLAAYFGLTGITRSILNGSIDPDIPDGKRRTPMWYAARYGHQDIVHQLLERTCETDIDDERRLTPLQVAAENGHEAVMRLLLNKGAQIDYTDKYGMTPVYWAAKNGHEAVLRLLLGKGAQIDYMDKDSTTPLHRAAGNGHEAIVRLLLDKGVRVDPTTELGDTPLYWAAENGHEAVMRLLLSKGAEIDHTDMYNITPLHRAVKNGHKTTVHFLLNEGAQIDHTDRYGKTPLLLAVLDNHKHIADTLIKHGAEINIRRLKDGSTPLIQAAEHGDWQMLELLLAAGADHRIKDSHGRSALMYAIIRNHLEAIDVLLMQDDLDPNTRDRWGSVAISFAARFGNMAVFRKIAALPNVDFWAQDCFGRTPLWWAQKQRYGDITREIVKHQQSTKHDIAEANVPGIGEPVEFFGHGGYCDICFASRQGSWFRCDECAGRL